MEFKYDDVSPSLISRIDPQALGSGVVVFYASRRHILEILPEALTSVWLVLTVIAIVTNVNATADCRHSQCIFLVSLATGLALGLFALWPFGLELWRWNRDIYYLTQYGWSHWYFSFENMDFHHEVMGFVTNTRVIRPTVYRVLGLDVGSLLAVSVDERTRFTPLMPHPYTLQTRIREAQAWKPTAPKVGEILWRE